MGHEVLIHRRLDWLVLKRLIGCIGTLSCVELRAQWMHLAQANYPRTHAYT